MNVYGVRIFTEDNRPATEEEVTSFVTGPSVNAGGSVLFGGGVVWNPSFGSNFPGTAGLQTGFGLPPFQLGLSAGLSVQLR